MRQSGSGLRRTFLYFSACLWGAEVALSPFFGVRVEELARGFFSLAIPKGPGRTCAIKWFGGLDQVRLTPLGEGFSPLPPRPFSQTACHLSATFVGWGLLPFSSVPEKPFLCLPNSWGAASYLPMEGFFFVGVVPVWGTPPASTPGLPVPHPLPF